MSIVLEEESELSASAQLALKNKEALKKLKCPEFVKLKLSYDTLRGVVKLGYNRPTPVQRLSIPQILTGRDMVIEARTGSGKTGAYLIPLLESLRDRSLNGTRALIIVPTKELADQVKNFFRTLTYYTKLTMAVLVGETALEEHFAAIHARPDVIITTPGRLLHVTMEMDLKFLSVQFVVLDEADRLMELGLYKELTEIFNRLSTNRQILIFSATLPKDLVQFAKTGLHNLQHISLDTDKRLSENLTMHHLYTIPTNKTPLLVYLLREVVKKDELTLVFLPTKLQVEFTTTLLHELGISCTQIHSGLDAEARRIHMAQFTNKEIPILLATDVAARGIDIPLLDNVINWNFPENPRLFVHRAGRVARAGRAGVVFNILESEELSLMLRVLQELSRPVDVVPNPFAVSSSDSTQAVQPAILYTNQLGRIPDSLLTAYIEMIHQKMDHVEDLKAMLVPCQRAQNKAKTIERQRSAAQGMRIPHIVVQQAKQVQDCLRKMKVGYHPLFTQRYTVNEEWEKFRFQMQSYTPKQTTLEKDCRSNKELQSSLRSLDADVERYRRNQKIKEVISGGPTMGPEALAKRNSDFIPYVTNVQNSLEKSAFEIQGDNDDGNKPKMQWNAKKHKYIQSGSDKPAGSKSNTMITSSGVKMAKSFNSGRYKKWLQHNSSVDFTKTHSKVLGYRRRNFHTKSAGQQDGGQQATSSNRGGGGGGAGRQVKRPEVIIKAMKQKERLKSTMKRNEMRNRKHSSHGKKKK